MKIIGMMSEYQAYTLIKRYGFCKIIEWIFKGDDSVLPVYVLVSLDMFFVDRGILKDPFEDERNESSN